MRVTPVHPVVKIGAQLPRKPLPEIRKVKIREQHRESVELMGRRAEVHYTYHRNSFGYAQWDGV